jgi:hypothetical protein
MQPKSVSAKSFKDLAERSEKVDLRQISGCFQANSGLFNAQELGIWLFVLD